MEKNKHLQTPMKVLLLGGTGAIGVQLTKILLDNGHFVYVTTRRERKSNNPNLEYIVGNAKEFSFLDDISNAMFFDVTFDFMVHSTNNFESISNLLLSSTKRYFYLSSYRIFDSNEKGTLNEASSLLLDSNLYNTELHDDDYPILKAKQENILRKSKFKNWTIVRPTMSYSNNRLQLGSLEADFFIPRIKNGLPIAFPIELLDKKTTLTWAGDVASLMFKLSDRTTTLNEDYNLATDENITWRQVIAIYEAKTSIKVIYVSLSDFLKFESDHNKLLYDRCFNRVCDNSKLINSIPNNQHNFSKVSDGLSKTISSTFSLKDEANTLNRMNGRMDRLLGIWQYPNINLVKYIKYLSGRLKIIDVFLARN